MQTQTKTGTIKPYNIVLDDNGLDASIDLYGEVVETRPTDWWTGELIPGNFIAVDEFLRDLESLNGRKNVTVHINSVGGDLYAGVAIYNRLKALAAHVTTINDGLAASAGSLIFQAGNTRKVNAGSNIMVHQAMGFLFGYYNNKQLRDAMKQLEAGNKAAVNIYSEASGRPADDMKAMVDRETWLTGQEAVDAGLADEVLDTTASAPVTMSLTADRRNMIVNGVKLSARCMSNIPAGIAVMSAAATVSPTAKEPEKNKHSNNERGTKNEMEIKTINDLRAAYPDLMNQAETAAREEGRAAGMADERARIQGIEAIQNAIADTAMIQAAKFGEKPLTAEQLAFQAMQAQAAIGAKMLNNMASDAAASGVENVGAAPNNGPEAEGMDPVDSAAEIAAAVNAANLFIKGGKK